MSLALDAVFINALSADSALMEDIDSNLYGTAIPVPDKDTVNTPLPFVIVTFDGMRNDTSDKDIDDMEGSEDIVTISVEVAAKTLDELHQLTTVIRNDIRDYMSNADNEAEGYALPSDYTLTAGAIQFDDRKPCFWQILTYECITSRG